MNAQLDHPRTESEPVRPRTIVRFAGSGVCLDQETIERVRHQLLDLAESPGASELVLDFDNVYYVSSSTLGTLITLHKRLAKHEKVQLCAAVLASDGRLTCAEASLVLSHADLQAFASESRLYVFMSLQI